MALACTGITVLALLNVAGVAYLSWLTPFTVVTLLGLIFAVYLIDIWFRRPCAQNLSNDCGESATITAFDDRC